MSLYVDGFVLAVPRDKIEAYRGLASKAGAVWREHGALEYRECVLEDEKPEWAVPFPVAFEAKPGETIVFAWITYRSRAHRDAVNAKVMADPRMSPDANPDSGEIFDHARMAYGGFEAIVDLAG
jgi:uncharacterized protein YbaA (DUF1428 family)